MTTRYYIYGITSAGSGATMAASSVGVAAGPVEIMPIGGLHVVVSTLEDREILPVRRNTISHTKVLEELMTKRITVLPMQFGVIFDDLSGIERVITSRKSQLADLLAELAGKIEVGITVRFNRDALIREIAGERPGMVSRGRALRSTDEVRSYHDRVALGQEVERLVRDWNEADRADLLARIKPFCIDRKDLKSSGEMTVLRSACLVESKVEPALYEVVEGFSKTRDQRCEISYLAPVPPYNFVRATLDWGRAADKGY